MSILRTYNVQNPDSASVNVELSASGGVKVAGVSTFLNTTIHDSGIDVGSGTITSHSINSTGIITASSFRGDASALTGIAVTTNVRTNSLVVSGVSTATGGIQVGATTSIIIGDTIIR